MSVNTTGNPDPANAGQRGRKRSRISTKGARDTRRSGGSRPRTTPCRSSQTSRQRHGLGGHLPQVQTSQNPAPLLPQLPPGMVLPPAPYPVQLPTTARYNSYHNQHQGLPQPSAQVTPQFGPPPPPPPPPQPPQLLPLQHPRQSLPIPAVNITGNPFLPPSIKVSLLRKIYREEYVDFEELLPTNHVASAMARHESVISIDRKSQTLRFDKDKIKKEKVDSLGKWMMAWNLYMQAYLHYHPNNYFKLFSYQKLFCQLANKYRFDACANYDMYFRRSMANQQMLDANERSVFWCRISEEYRAMYLMDFPLPTCFDCKGRGHYAKNCPHKGQTDNVSHSSAVVAYPTTAPSSSFRRQRSHNNQQQQQQQHQTTNVQATQQQAAQRSTVSAQVKPCFRFNGTGQCNKPPCQFLHICSICFKDNHAAKDCYTQSSSTFRPGTQPNGFQFNGP